MFKKAISLVSALSLLTLTVPGTVFADTINADLIKTPIDLSANSQTFEPAAGQTLTAKVTFNTTKANGTGDVVVKQGATVIRTLATINGFDAAAPLNLSWNGKDVDASGQAICGAVGAACPNGDYSIVANVASVFGADTLVDTEIATFKIGNVPPISFSAVTLTPETSFDPSASGANQDLKIDFTLNQTVDSISLEIRNKITNELMKGGAASNLASGSFSWNGETSSKIVEPGTYEVKLTATKAGQTTASTPKDIAVAYNNVNKGSIDNFTVTPTTFDPGFEVAVIEFKNTKDTNLTVEILDFNNGIVKTFDAYTDDNYGSNKTHSISWNGTNNSGSSVALTNYKIKVISRNEFGVVASEKSVTVNNSGGSVSTSNAHISAISFSPSSKFKPADDENLEIEWDVKQDLDELKIFAVGGGKGKIELYSEEDVKKDNNLQLEWDGTDKDDEYVADGSWKILFESKKGSTTLLAVKSINIHYEKPKIKDLYLSKSKFDNDKGEFTNILFRVDTDAEVTIKVIDDGDEDDDVVEDMEVEADQWYSVQWDGGGYDYDDNLDLKLIASNIANENIFDSKKIDVDLAEDKTSGSKANVTQDYIDPPITDGNSEMTIYYNLEDEADVTITIHAGKSTTGSTKIELLDVDDQDSGEHSVSWNGKDSNGKKLSAGFYTYKIVAKTSSSEVESGVFVVGNVGNFESGSSVKDGKKAGSVGPGVIVDGGNGSDDEEDGIKEPPAFENCSGFYDVSSGHVNCTAIEWAQDTGVFQGYGNGIFAPEKPINRVEFLKVILLALGIKENVGFTGTAGFKDVEDGAWYMPFVAKAKTLGIFVGDQGKGTARPADSVNRAEALKMLFVSINSAGGEASLTSCANIYNDVPSDAWFQPYVACFNYSYNLVDPVDSKHFVPSKPVTRAEVAEMLYRVYQMNIL